MSLINETKAWIVDKFAGNDRQSLWVRNAAPSLADIMALFNPLAIPLLCYDRIAEVLERDETEVFPQGYYFINSTFIQFSIQFGSTSYLDAEIIENNIFLLDHNTALSLDTTDGETMFGIDDIFLELD